MPINVYSGAYYEYKYEEPVLVPINSIVEIIPAKFVSFGNFTVEEKDLDKFLTVQILNIEKINRDDENVSEDEDGRPIPKFISYTYSVKALNNEEESFNFKTSNYYFKPLARPLATPLAKPLATPLARPLATPLAKPLATPLAKPLATPLAKPRSNSFFKWFKKNGGSNKRTKRRGRSVKKKRKTLKIKKHFYLKKKL